MDRYGVKLSCHGLMIEPVERKGNESVLEFCYRVIGCRTIDIVTLQCLGDLYCMVVDDEGLFVDKPHLNAFASYLYGSHMHGQPIVGDVVLMKNVQTPDGVETVWLSKEEANALTRDIGHNVLNVVNELNNAIKKGVL